MHPNPIPPPDLYNNWDHQSFILNFNPLHLFHLLLPPDIAPSQSAVQPAVPTISDSMSLLSPVESLRPGLPCLALSGWVSGITRASYAAGLAGYAVTKKVGGTRGRVGVDPIFASVSSSVSYAGLGGYVSAVVATGLACLPYGGL